MIDILEVLSSQVSTLQKISGKKYVIYTCVTNGYSEVIPAPSVLRSNFHFILFTDKPTNVDGWTNFLFNPMHSDHRRSAKFCKILPAKFLSAYESSVWVDGNFELHPALNQLFQRFLHANEILLVFRHRNRNCVYAEGIKCLRWGKDLPEVINQQMIDYKNLGHPEGWGLFMGGFLMRKHKTIGCEKVMQDWWDNLEKYSVRDQISLPVVLRQNKTLFLAYPHEDASTYFNIAPHLKYRSYKLTGKNLINVRALIAPYIYTLTSFINRLRNKLRRM